MNSTTINHVTHILQEAQEGKVTMQGIALTNLIHRIIREYGKYDRCDYSVYLSDIEPCDQKLLLSHVLDSGEYKWTIMNDLRTKLMFKESEKYFQKLIDSECFVVWKEDMEEMGMSTYRHLDNDEPYFARR